MTEQHDGEGSGSDGSWFLEAVGASPPSPTPSETIAALETENTLVEMAAVPASTTPLASFDGETGTSTSTYDRPTDATPPLDDLTGDMDVIAPLTDDPTASSDDLGHVLGTRRSFRWPAIAFGLFILAVVALAVLWLPAALQQDATVVKQSYADASVTLRQELPTGQDALDTITDPSSTSAELSGAVPQISQLDSAAHGLATVAAEPLPRQLPVFPVEEITALEPLQDSAQINAAQGSHVARQLGTAYVYRTTIPALLPAGPLPVVADVQTINALSIELASSLVEASAAVSDLPTTEATADLNVLAHATVERFAAWQDEYLTALTDGDEEAATQLLAELDDMRSDLTVSLAAAMSTMRVEIDLQIVELAGDLEEFLVELTR